MKSFCLLAVISLVSAAGWAQTDAGSAGTGVRLNPFLGGVPSGSATGEVLSLTLPDAVERGLQHNLGLLSSDLRAQVAHAGKIRAVSELLPTLTTEVTERSQQSNLKAFGFSGFPGVEPIVGPFAIFDARAHLSQSIVDLRAIRQAKAGKRALEASQCSYQDARDNVVVVVASLYLQAKAGAARIDAANAQVETADALFQQATDRKAAGLVPGIEVLRANVILQEQQQRLIHYQNEFEKEKLTLARAIGLPAGQRFELASEVPYAPRPPVTLDEALDMAYTSRADYQAAQALLRAAESMRSAAKAERLPSLSFAADYGAIGPNIGNSHGTYTAAGVLNIPVFQGGRVRADVMQADAEVQQKRADLEDLRAQIDFDVRTVFLDLEAAGKQVEVAQSSVDLARQQLEQARDRFAAGVTDNIEVVQAQEAQATAQDRLISSLFAYNLAKASLARAIGAAEKSTEAFLGVK
jgi:outer membrane protein TolC